MSTRSPSNMTDLPLLEVPHSPDEIVTALDRAARKGRLAGFTAERSDSLFAVDAWGTPFDADLLAAATEAGGRTTLSFRTRWRRKMPAIFAVTLILTVWPGVELTDSLLKLWFDWYFAFSQREIFQIGGFDAFTYLWYLPLTAVPLPWVWRSLMRKSRASIHASALEMIGKIATELGVSPSAPLATSPVPASSES